MALHDCADARFDFERDLLSGRHMAAFSFNDVATLMKGAMLERTLTRISELAAKLYVRRHFSDIEKLVDTDKIAADVTAIIAKHVSTRLNEATQLPKRDPVGNEGAL